ncbi:MAG TPA: transcription elongation factor GreA [Acidimicrobiia bacterium]|jgi:transcription elongation factor GreA|nr:transcription elongation factor GreA [Acidimicrobiia bacterium]
MTDDTTWLTPEAYEKFSKELEYLKTEGRAEIEARIAEARSHGDLRENADYDAAKNDQGMMEARIRQLEDLLRRAEVREATHDGTVQIGSVVTVLDDDGDEVRYFVATPENKVPGMALASPDGPLGSALLGAKVGDRVTYEAPGGTFSVEITAIEPYRE